MSRNESIFQQNDFNLVLKVFCVFDHTFLYISLNAEDSIRWMFIGHYMNILFHVSDKQRQNNVCVHDVLLVLLCYHEIEMNSQCYCRSPPLDRAQVLQTSVCLSLSLSLSCSILLSIQMPFIGTTILDVFCF